MDKCKDCIHYDDKNTYKDTGYCHLWDGYTKMMIIVNIGKVSKYER